jgi:hypothetical protein
MKKLIILFLILGGGYFVYTKLPHSADYLHGTWKVVHDPDNPNSKETFQLTEHGEFIFEDRFKCIYAHVTDDEVSVLCKFKNGESRELIFELSPDKQILTNPSGTTYKRI